MGTGLLPHLIKKQFPKLCDPDLLIPDHELYYLKIIGLINQVSHILPFTNFRSLRDIQRSRFVEMAIEDSRDQHWSCCEP